MNCIFLIWARSSREAVVYLFVLIFSSAGHFVQWSRTEPFVQFWKRAL